MQEIYRLGQHSGDTRASMGIGRAWTMIRAKDNTQPDATLCGEYATCWSRNVMSMFLTKAMLNITIVIQTWIDIFTRLGAQNTI